MKRCWETFQTSALVSSRTSKLLGQLGYGDDTTAMRLPVECAARKCAAL